MTTFTDSGPIYCRCESTYVKHAGRWYHRDVTLSDKLTTESYRVCRQRQPVTTVLAFLLLLADKLLNKTCTRGKVTPWVIFTSLLLSAWSFISPKHVTVPVTSPICPDLDRSHSPVTKFILQWSRFSTAAGQRYYKPRFIWWQTCIWRISETALASITSLPGN